MNKKSEKLNNNRFSLLLLIIFNLLKLTPDIVDSAVLLIMTLLRIDSIRKDIVEMFFESFDRYFIDCIEGYNSIERIKPIVKAIFSNKELLEMIEKPVETFFGFCKFFTDDVFRNTLDNNFGNSYLYHLNTFEKFFNMWIKSLNLLIKNTGICKIDIDLILEKIETLLKKTV